MNKTIKRKIIDRNTPQRKEKIAKRKQRGQEKILEELRKMPIISVAAERANIGRTTVYQWIRESKEFEKSIDEAMREGDQFLDDMSESQLMALTKDKYWPAIKFRLERHHPKFLSEKFRAAQEKKSELKIIVLKEHETQL